MRLRNGLEPKWAAKTLRTVRSVRRNKPYLWALAANASALTVYKSAYIPSK